MLLAIATDAGGRTDLCDLFDWQHVFFSHCEERLVPALRTIGHLHATQQIGHTAQHNPHHSAHIRQLPHRQNQPYTIKALIGLCVCVVCARHSVTVLFLYRSLLVPLHAPLSRHVAVHHTVRRAQLSRPTPQLVPEALDVVDVVHEQYATAGEVAFDGRTYGGAAGFLIVW